ncbi:MAG: hypothetical protein U0234_22540 [Sandaracinus sp.]
MNKVSRLVLVLAAMGLGTSCSQSRHDGMQRLCDSWARCEQCPSAPVATRATLLFAQIQADVSNEEVLALLRDGRDLPGPERAARLREAAAAEGIPSCALADEMAGW